jgi:hypothetical protein
VPLLAGCRRILAVLVRQRADLEDPLSGRSYPCRTAPVTQTLSPDENGDALSELTSPCH